MPIQAPQWTEYLTCPICYNEFEDQIRQPVSLGCGHTLCKSCLAQLHRTQCPFDQASVNTDINELPINTALLQLVGADISDAKLPNIQCIKDNATEYRESKRYIEELALFLKPLTSTGSNENLKISTGAISSNGNVLTRPMQRKLVTLVNCQLAEEEGRMKAMRAARSLGERTVTELILLHQNQQQLSANLWAAVRARGCQFLGPAMQEEALHYILLALEGGEALSRKVLVLFVVQRLETNFPQASKTSIGHVVQLLYRASCFKVTKRDDDSSLMQLKENFRTLEALRKEHDAQIVHIATEAGLRISPDQWSSLLYGDLEHKSHMQSIIDKLQTPASFATSIQELIIALQRSGDPGQLTQLRGDFNLLSKIDPSPEAVNPTWPDLKEGMRAVHAVVHGLVDFQRTYGNRMKGSNEPQQAHSSKFKTSLCRDFQRGNCPRGNSCTFAHSDDEMKRYGRKREGMKPVIPRGQPPSGGVGGEQYSPGVTSGTVEGQPLTEGGGQSSNTIAASRSPPVCVPAPGVEMSNGYRAHSQHTGPMRQQNDMVSRMSKLSVHSQQPMYSESPGYVPPPGHYERMPYSPTAPQNGMFAYYGQSPPVTMGNGSYSSVAARTDMKPGMLSPRNSPQAVQDENLPGSRESPVTNGHLDPSVHRRRGYQTEILGRRRELGNHIQAQPSPAAAYPYPTQYGGMNYAPFDVHCRSSAEMFHNPYGGGRYEAGPQGPVLAGYTAYRTDMGDYYNVMPYIPSYNIPERMISRKPYIPDDSKITDCSKRTNLEVTDGTGKLDGCHRSLGNIADLLGDLKPGRKDTGPSSSSSGVSSASPLSHSPAASHSSSSSLSPRGSPVTWQSGSDGDYILSQLYSSSSDGGNLPPPPTIWSSSQSDGKGWPSNLGLLIPAYHSDQEKHRQLPETGVRNISDVDGSIEQTDRAIARTLQTCYDEEYVSQVQCKTNDMERREALDRTKKEQEKADLEVATSLQRLEEKEELERKKKREEYQRLLIERKMLLEKQKREKQELMDRKLAERIAFQDAQQAGLVRPEPIRYPLPIGHNPDVISRGLPVSSHCHHSKPDDFGAGSVPKIGGFSSFTGFHNGCGSSLGNDEDIDGPKIAPGSSSDIRVQE